MSTSFVRSFWMASGVIVAVSALSFPSTGCRRLSVGDGEGQIGDFHVLRGRPDSAGGPRLTGAELASRSFVSTTADLAPLEAAIGDHLRADADLLGDVVIRPDAMVTEFDARRGTFPIPPGPGTFLPPRRHAFDPLDSNPISVSGLAGEINALCAPLLVPFLPPGTCPAPALPPRRLLDLLADEWTLHVNSPSGGSTSLAWRAPITGDPVPSAPVLGVQLDVPIEFRQAASGFLFDLRLTRAVVEYGLQPVPCAPGTCRFDQGPLAVNYGSPFAPATNVPDVGLDLAAGA